MNKIFRNKITVIGLGYIGLPTAAILANHNFKVAGVDIDHTAIDKINNTNISQTEPSLEFIVRNAVLSGNLRASHVIEPSDVFIIAVPTPVTQDKKPDMTIINSVVAILAPQLKKGDLIIIESTIPVNMTQKISNMLSDFRKDLKFPGVSDEVNNIFISYCPERVLPGNIANEIIHNDRIIGGITPKCSKKAAELYKTFVKGKILLSEARIAEMTKLAENAYRDVNIAFANELSMICDSLGVNSSEVINLANLHPRVNILQPGPGVGGHCIAIDPWFLVDSTPNNTDLIRTARKVNDKKIDHVTNQIAETIECHKNPTIAFFGATYKNDVDDIRESPAIKIIDNIASKFSFNMLLVEPYLNTIPIPLNKYAHLKMSKFNEAINSATILILLVKHSEFLRFDWKSIKKRRILDTAGILTKNNS